MANKFEIAGQEVSGTKNFRKYKLVWEFEMEPREREILLSADHVYVRKDLNGIDQIVITLERADDES